MWAGVTNAAPIGAITNNFWNVRRIRGPQQTIESVRETRDALTPGHDRSPTKAVAQTNGSATPAPAPTDPSGW